METEVKLRVDFSERKTSKAREVIQYREFVRVLRKPDASGLTLTRMQR